MDSNRIMDRLEHSGFIRVGKPGFRATFTRRDLGVSFRVKPSIRMRCPDRHLDVHREKDGKGSIYVHEDESVIVATGKYMDWLKSLREPNGDMAISTPYPAWCDFPEDGDHAVTDLLNALPISNQVTTQI